MAEVINISEAPLAKLRKQLDQAKQDKERFKRDLMETRQKLATLVSVNEMLRLQLNELEGMLTMFQHQLNGMTHNIHNLRNKLPKIDSNVPHSTD